MVPHPLLAGFAKSIVFGTENEADATSRPAKRMFEHLPGLHRFLRNVSGQELRKQATVRSLNCHE
jgi:hypothetical protein